MNLIKLYVTIFIFHSGLINSQNINGIYQSDFTQFVNLSDKSKNFSKPTKDIVIIDITELSEVKGTIILQSKDENNETYGLKFKVFGTKTIQYDQGYTHYSFKAKLYILDEEVKNKTYLIYYSFNSENRYIIINFPEGSHQTWIINQKL